MCIRVYLILILFQVNLYKFGSAETDVPLHCAKQAGFHFNWILRDFRHFNTFLRPCQDFSDWFKSHRQAGTEISMFGVSYTDSTTAEEVPRDVKFPLRWQFFFYCKSMQQCIVSDKSSSCNNYLFIHSNCPLLFKQMLIHCFLSHTSEIRGPSLLFNSVYPPLMKPRTSSQSYTHTHTHRIYSISCKCNDVFPHFGSKMHL